MMLTSANAVKGSRLSL